MKKVIAIVICSCTMLAMTYGQGTADLLRLSQTNYATATARSAAMAGAFTSLGGDGVAMSINPAGLAMFNQSQVNFTLLGKFSSNSTDYSGLNSTSSNNSKIALGNFSVIMAGLGNFTLGIGYNRLNDYHSKSAVYGDYENTSIGQMYMEQLNGISASDIGSPQSDPYQAFYKYVPSLWNGIMGYQSGLVNPTSSGNQYNMAGIFDYQNGDLQKPQGILEKNGALHEYVISGSYNLKNKLYFGLSLGIQNMLYNEEYRYSEVASGTNTGSLDNFTLKQTLNQNAVGFNFKVGATLNLDFLRIGIAYHSPTWGTMRENSYSNITVYDKTRTGYGFSDTPILNNNYKYTTVSRFLAGISTTIAKKVIISADYELATYGNMKFRTDANITGFRQPINAGAIDNLQTIANYYDGKKVDINGIVSDYYKASHNFRCAVEYRPIQKLFLRAGYASYGSMYKDSALDDYGKYQQITAGIGVRFWCLNLDLAYVYGKQKNLPSTFFKYVADDGYTVMSKGTINSENTNNMVLLTITILNFLSR